MVSKILKVISVALVIALVAACEPAPRQHHQVQKQNVKVHQYRSHVDGSNDWLYWYVIYLNSSNSTQSTYYYSSPTPVSNFSSVNFTRGGSSLPKEVEQQIEKAEQLPETELATEAQPAEIAQEVEQVAETEAAQLDAQQDAMTNEGGPDPTPADTSESVSSDTSSSSDSGSSDSGGGGGE
jgi:hypothetical protein